MTDLPARGAARPPTGPPDPGGLDPNSVDPNALDPNAFDPGMDPNAYDPAGAGARGMTNSTDPYRSTAPRSAAADGGDDLPGEPLSSLGDIVSDIARDVSTLVRQETELAKAELKESATRAGKGAGMLGGAGLAGYFVLLFLSVALWWLIGSWIGLGWSALVVAVIWAIIAAILYSMGRKELKRIAGMPKTVETAKQIPDAMKGNE